MKLFKAVLAIYMLVLCASDTSAQTGRHSFITDRDGDLYIFMKVGAPFTPEQIHFMSEVNNLKGLKVLTYFKEMNQEELQAWQDSPETYHKRYEYEGIENAYSKEAVAKYNTKPKPFKFRQLIDLSMIDKLGVKTFPRIVYLSPDGFTYNFEFPPFRSEPTIKKFWDAYEKHKGKDQKMWLKKQWGVNN